MELKVKLYIADDEGGKFMGLGVLWLLEKIQSEGSLKRASESLGISYSKAYYMIANAEKNLGVHLIDRKKGGVERHGAVLTPFAIGFISLYRDFQDKAKKLVEGPYEEFSTALEALKEEYRDGQTV